MKQINFTCKEILPSLLDKSKKSTIRKAWVSDKQMCFFHTTEKDDCNLCDGKGIKPAKHKVGDVVELTIPLEILEKYLLNEFLNSGWKKKGDYVISTKIKITESFMVEMNKKYINPLSPEPFGRYLTKREANIFAKKEGFKSAKEMFTCIDKIYDLSQPRKFWCYRWRWLE